MEKKLKERLQEAVAKAKNGEIVNNVIVGNYMFVHPFKIGKHVFLFNNHKHVASIGKEDFVIADKDDPVIGIIRPFYKTKRQPQKADNQSKDEKKG